MENIHQLNQKFNELLDTGKEYLTEHIILKSDILSKLNIPRDGYWLEFGVFSGDTINKLSHFCDKIYGFDSFQGLPEDWVDDFPKGTFCLDNPPNVLDNVELVIGWFEDSIPKFFNKHNIDKITFINIDCDLYSSTKTIFKYLGQYIKSGTYIYFDEFIIERNEKNEALAFVEFLNKYELNYEIISLAGSKDHIQTLVKIK